MFQVRRPKFALLPVASTIVAALCLPAGAEEPTKSCVGDAVRARGEPSQFEWSARAKTRANWRQKVRAMTGLGDPYANWKRAENAQWTCEEGPAGTVCEFSGVPCKKGS